MGKSKPKSVKKVSSRLLQPEKSEKKILVETCKKIVDVEKLPLVWGFRFARTNINTNPYCPFKYLKEHPDFFIKLSQLEDLGSIGAVKANGAHHHYSQVKCNKANEWLYDCKLDDCVDEIFSLRLNNKLRVWGILAGNIVNVLWIDPEHQIHPSKKKHT